MVALERIKEYTELKREPAEIIEPRPPAVWPAQGQITVEDLSIRYAVSKDYPSTNFLTYILGMDSLNSRMSFTISRSLFSLAKRYGCCPVYTECTKAEDKL